MPTWRRKGLVWKLLESGVWSLESGSFWRLEIGVWSLECFRLSPAAVADYTPQAGRALPSKTLEKNLRGATDGGSEANERGADEDHRGLVTQTRHR